MHGDSHSCKIYKPLPKQELINRLSGKHPRTFLYQTLSARILLAYDILVQIQYNICNSILYALSYLFLLFSLTLIFLLRYFVMWSANHLYCILGGLSFLLIGIAFLNPRA